jgi:hypothetical protein
LDGTTRLQFEALTANRANEVRRVATVRRDFDIDAASVIVEDHKGRRWRLPKGSPVFDRPFPTGWPRGVRECVSERFLANLHGTFYEIPRASDNRSPELEKIKPVCSHSKLIADYCTWRGLLVISGTRRAADDSGQYFADAVGRGLWFGAIDDLWKLGKPVGRGGPWLSSEIESGVPSDPYLMTGYDKKRLELSHDADTDVTFTLEVDFNHYGFVTYNEITVPAGEQLIYTFPDGFHAHWARLAANRDCRATATFVYD